MLTLSLKQNQNITQPLISPVFREIYSTQSNNSHQPLQFTGHWGSTTQSHPSRCKPQITNAFLQPLGLRLWLASRETVNQYHQLDQEPGVEKHQTSEAQLWDVLQKLWNTTPEGNFQGKLVNLQVAICWPSLKSSSFSYLDFSYFKKCLWDTAVNAPLSHTQRPLQPHCISVTEGDTQHHRLWGRQRNNYSHTACVNIKAAPKESISLNVNVWIWRRASQRTALKILNLMKADVGLGGDEGFWSLWNFGN